MVQFVFSLLAAVRVFFSTRRDTALEVLALRQQVAVLKRKRPRPPLNSFDRLFWTTLRRLCPRWTDLLVIVKPETVIAWHRAGFRLYLRWRSRPSGGRPAITEEVRGRIRGPAKRTRWSPEDSWRKAEVWLPHLRTECGSLAEAYSAAGDPGQA